MCDQETLFEYLYTHELTIEKYEIIIKHCKEQLQRITSREGKANV